MLEIDQNVNIPFIITGSIQYLNGRAAEHNVGLGPTVWVLAKKKSRTLPFEEQS